MRPIRWSGEGDRYWGPFTFCRSDSEYDRLSLYIDSGKHLGLDGDYPPMCSIHLSVWRYTLIAAIPPIVKPFARKIFPQWDADTIARLGRDFYWDVSRRMFGFSYGDGFLQVFRGRRTDDSSTDRTWSMFMPWRGWRTVRRSYYDREGIHFYTLRGHGSWKAYERRFGEGAWRNQWTAERAVEDACPTVCFAFRDFDGELIKATTKIEERESAWGEGRWRWLSLFRRNKVYRSLDLAFSAEVGKRKGSWKGGTVGHSISMLPGELHQAAFERYCAENNLTFVCVMPPLNPDGTGTIGAGQQLAVEKKA